MTEIDSHIDDLIIDTDIFVVIENEENFNNFVTIDEDAAFDSIVIDISPDESMDAITVNIEPDSDDFVSIDDDQVFLSDFMEDDILTDWYKSDN
ncbi:hypothetical protein FACS189426_23090 [Bacteroidia bacterium]|nr:hypothetical protein FACS189426_23090 [Bacteroidia bacterium]